MKRRRRSVKGIMRSMRNAIESESEEDRQLFLEAIRNRAD